MTITEDYPSGSSETSGLLRDQFVKTFKWYDMYTEKKNFSRSKVFSLSSDPAKLKSCSSRVAKHYCHQESRHIHQDTIRRWERSAQDKSCMCIQAAGLSQCLTKVQESMVTQLKVLHGDKGKANLLVRHSKLLMNWTIWLHLIDYLKARINQDTLTALHNSPLHMSSLFPDYLLAKAEEELSHHQVKRSTQRLPSLCSVWQASTRT